MAFDVQMDENVDYRAVFGSIAMLAFVKQVGAFCEMLLANGDGD